MLKGLGFRAPSGVPRGVVCIWALYLGSLFMETRHLLVFCNLDSLSEGRAGAESGPGTMSWQHGDFYGHDVILA